MSILLGITAFDDATVSYVDAGGILRPIMQGGALQKLNRLGDHFAVTYNVGEVRSDSPEGRLLRSQLIRAKKQGAIALFPQDGTIIGSPGTPAFDGSGQTGSVPALRGFNPSYQLYAGWYFSIINGGRRYVHMFDADTVTDGAGKTSVPISPMLRTSPSNGAIVEVETPYIEGLITSDISFVMTPGNWQGQTVTIEESM